MNKLEYERQLALYDNKYYSASAPSISDQEYDALITQYELVYGNYTPNVISRNKCVLPCYSPSLTKLKLKTKLLNWTESYKGPYVIMDKIDGMSLILEYTQDKITIYTHATDGIHGTNVSHLLPYLNIPKNIMLNKNDILIVRGELFIKKNIFEKYKDNGEYQSERNCIPGVVNATKNINYNILSDFSFNAFSIQKFVINSNIEKLTISEQLIKLQEFNFDIVSYKIQNYINFEELTLALSQQTDIPRDGYVIANDIYEDNVKYGLPLNIIAFKIMGDCEETIVTQVEWNESIYCLLKPRINYNPVYLDGGNLTWCSGFNAKFIKDNNIGPGTRILITRSGSINPYIVEIIEPTEASFPNCKYTWNSTNMDIMCIVNDNVKIKRIYTFFKSLNVKYLGLSTIKKLYHGGLNDIISYYNATIDTITSIKGFNTKGAERLIESIKQSVLNATMDKVMNGSCIFQNFGSKKLNDILNYCQSLYNIILYNHENTLTLKDLQSVPGIKDCADNFLNALPDFIIFLNNIPIIKNKLIEHYNKPILNDNNLILNIDNEITYDNILNPPIIIPDFKEMILIGMVIVFSGDKKLTETVKSMGAIVDNGVTKRTTLLVLDNLGTMNAKEVKCIKNNIPIISLKEFKDKYKLN
jgi:DNA ligase (NAD+)